MEKMKNKIILGILIIIAIIGIVSLININKDDPYVGTWESSFQNTIWYITKKDETYYIKTRAQEEHNKFTHMNGRIEGEYLKFDKCLYPGEYYLYKFEGEKLISYEIGSTGRMNKLGTLKRVK